MARFLLTVIALSLLIPTSLCQAADGINCPATIATRQEMASPANGWTPLLDDTPHNLAGITFYDGPPAEKASLAYDRIQHGKGEQVAVWIFARHEDRRIWLVCSYAGTAVELSRSLPPRVTTCTVSYNPQQQVAGLPMINKITCR